MPTLVKLNRVLARSHFTSPMGRGRIAERHPGEGLWTIESPRPPHPNPLPNGEREQTLPAALAFI